MPRLRGVGSVGTRRKHQPPARLQSVGPVEAAAVRLEPLVVELRDQSPPRAVPQVFGGDVPQGVARANLVGRSVLVRSGLDALVLLLSADLLSADLLRADLLRADGVRLHRVG